MNEKPETKKLESTQIENKIAGSDQEISLPTGISQDIIDKYSEKAQGIKSAMENIDRMQYVDQVEQIIPYIHGMQIVADNTKLGGTPIDRVFKLATQARATLNSLSDPNVKISPELIQATTSILKASGRTNEQINAIIQQRDKIIETLFTTSVAAEAASKGIDTSGRINPELAEKNLYDHFAEIEKTRRLGNIISE